MQPKSRAAYGRLLGRSWTDAIRNLYPGERIYTFWHCKRARWQRDAGLRLGHLLLSPNLRDRSTDVGVDEDVRGREGASDHAPAWIRLR
jgi:exodeoxyribonuclease III